MFIKNYFFIIFVIKLSIGLKIGGVFDQDNDFTDEIDLDIFQYSIDYLNMISEKNFEDEEIPTLEGIPLQIPYADEFSASQMMCELLNNSVAAVVGPTSPDSSQYIQSVCDEKEIPFIQSIWDPHKNKVAFVNLYPHPDSIEAVLVDLVRAFEWTSFTILYESAQWLPRVSNLLKLYDSKGFTVTVRQLRMLSHNDYRAVLKRVKKSEDKEIIIDCSIDALNDVLEQAQQVGLFTDQHQLIISNLDLHTINWEPYSHSGTNITGIRMIDPNDKYVKEVTQFWREEYLKEYDPESYENEFGKGKSDQQPEMGLTYVDEDDEDEDEDEGDTEDYEPAKIYGLDAETLRLSSALIFDSILIFHHAVRSIRGVSELEPSEMDCNGFDSWKHGHTISNFMRTTPVQGLTKRIIFDSSGFRIDVDLDVIELTTGGIKKVGMWNASHHLTMMREPIQQSEGGFDNSLRNRTLRVLIAKSPPYGMLKEDAQTLSGNDRYEGFGIELIEKLSELLGFNYVFVLQEDGVYGTQDNVTKEWNGMLGEIIADRAELAITDLTITSDRESAVDFTMPFMNLGISILYRKPTKQAPAFFSFMSPFSNEVWLYLGGAYLGVSVCLFLLGRISPNEWDNPYPCIEEPDELENQFSFRNAMWFTIGALLQQGTELAPRTPSTRTVASIWWFFTLIMVSSYTANLAAFLTVDTITSPINSASDLANLDGEIMYGAKLGGSTINFFRDADVEIYKKMYDYMSKHKELLTANNEDGLKMVKSKNYAFLMESTSIEYITERTCDVTQVGGLLDDKGYGIAMKKDSSFRGILSESVLRLQEQGKLTEMKTKWWKEKRGGGLCADSASDEGAVPLGIANVLGIFVLLILGVVAAFLINLITFVFTIAKSAREKQSKAQSDSATELDMGNVGGVFLVLLVGSLISSFIGCLRWVNCIRRRAKYSKVPFKEEFMEEFKFVIKCHGNTKTVKQSKSASTDSRQSGISGTSLRSRGSSSGRDHIIIKPESCEFKPSNNGKQRKEDLDFEPI